MTPTLPNGTRIIWTLHSRPAQARPLQPQAEIETLKRLLDHHIDELDRAELEIREFVDWAARSPVALPKYCLGGFREILGDVK